MLELTRTKKLENNFKCHEYGLTFCTHLHKGIDVWKGNRGYKAAVQNASSNYAWEIYEN